MLIVFNKVKYGQNDNHAMNKCLLPFFLFVTAVLSGCTANEINAGVNIASNVLQSTTINNEQLVTKARLSAKVMDEKYQVASTNDPYAKRLSSLTQGLQNYDGMRLNFKVYRSDKINAFAMPDGSVRIFTGLMDLMNDDELLSVIGHEIGHVKNQHSLKQYKKAYLTRAAATGLSAYGGSTVSQLTNTYGKIGVAAIDARFSQKDELESDEYGVMFLSDIGRNPYAAYTAQKKLMTKGRAAGGFFSSHPSSEKRLKLVKMVADRVGKQ